MMVRSSKVFGLLSWALIGASLFACSAATSDGENDAGGTGDTGTTTDAESDGGSKDGATTIDDATTADAASDARTDAKTDAGKSDAGDGAANACMAEPVSSVRPFVASPVHKGACTAQQIIDYRANCFDSSEPGACEDWVNDPANSDCYDCDGDVDTKSEYGVGTLFEVGEGTTFQLNFGGWIQVLDPSKSACATKVQALMQCRVKSCATACPIPGDSASDDEYFDAVDALDTCIDDSTETTCKTYADDADCLAAEQNNPLLAPVFNYLNGTTDDELNDAYFQTLTVMCGPTHVDGGSDAATDAANDAANDATGD